MLSRRDSAAYRFQRHASSLVAERRSLGSHLTRDWAVRDSHDHRGRKSSTLRPQNGSPTWTAAEKSSSWRGRRPAASTSTSRPDLLEQDRINVYEQWQSVAHVEAFRGSGPSEEQATAIRDAAVFQHEVASSRRL